MVRTDWEPGPYANNRTAALFEEFSAVAGDGPALGRAVDPPGADVGGELVLADGQVRWTGLCCRLASRQAGEQKTWRLVGLATVKSLSQTGQRRAMCRETQGCWAGQETRAFTPVPRVLAWFWWLRSR